MPQKITNLAKNTSYFTLALILQKIISFTYFTLIARALGPSDLGKYYFAISFAAIFSILADLGQTNVLTREIAKDQSRARNYFGAVLATKIPLAALTGLIVITLANLFGYDPLVRELIYLSTACIVLDSFTAMFFSVSRGFHNLSFESVSAVIFQLIVMSTGLTVIKFDLGLNWLIGSLVLASIFNFFYSLIVIASRWGIKLRPIFDPKLIKLIIALSLPFGVYAIFQKIYGYFDTVMLATLAGDYFVGIYQIPFKIFGAIQFLPLAFVASLYPAMSAYWASNRDQLAVTFERAMNYLIIISIPITFGVVALADKIILIFKSDFTEAILPLQITIAALSFMFAAYPVGSLLNAADKQKINTVNMGLTLVASVILNLILIPKFQTVGASLAVLFTSIFLLILGLIQVPKLIKYNAKKILIVLAKTLASAALMATMILYLKNSLNAFIIIPAAALFYFLILLLLKGFSFKDLKSIYESFNKRPSERAEIEAAELENN